MSFFVVGEFPYATVLCPALTVMDFVRFAICASAHAAVSADIRPRRIHRNATTWCRVNGINTEWFEEDVRAAAKSGADAVLLPKTEATSDISHLQDLLIKHGAPVTQEICAFLPVQREHWHTYVVSKLTIYAKSAECEFGANRVHD